MTTNQLAHWSLCMHGSSWNGLPLVRSASDSQTWQRIAFFSEKTASFLRIAQCLVIALACMRILACSVFDSSMMGLIRENSFAEQEHV